MSKLITAALIIIGDEILSGRTQDANLSHLAHRLNEKGVQLKHARVISDDEDIIVETLNDLRGKYDYVFTTGGIGPTHDDITSASVAKAFGVEWVVSDEARDMLQQHYDKINVEMNAARLRMATIPKGAELIKNPVSTAPGFKIENVFVLAGVPKIMQAMLDDALDKIEGGYKILSRTIGCELGEGTVAELLKNLQDKYDHLSIGSYPVFTVGNFALNIVLRSYNEDILNRACDDLCRDMVKMGARPTID